MRDKGLPNGMRLDQGESERLLSSHPVLRMAISILRHVGKSVSFYSNQMIIVTHQMIVVTLAALNLSVTGIPDFAKGCQFSVCNLCSILHKLLYCKWRGKYAAYSMRRLW